ncbi:MAG: HAMP domain-containing sensor histidine kinase [bacterium]|nr:HAMP domain-containing sensor histidine kinase [bacterium]
MRGVGYRVIIFAGILFLLSLALVLPVSREIEKGIDAESKAITLLISSIIAHSENIELAFAEIKEILGEVNFPIVMTNELGLPVAWASIDVPSEKYTINMLYRPDLLKDDPDYLRLISWMGKLGEKHDPYEVKKGEEVIGYIYYGYPKYTTWIRLLPFVVLVISLAASIFLVEAGRVIHTYEVETIWANFARGLAHQMGTPVSALMGWLEFLKTGNCSDKIITAMEKDILRLRSILQRFSRVGGKVKKEVVRVDEMLKELISELKERFLKNVEVTLECEAGLTVEADRELLAWAFENLIKNSYEALGPSGKIVVKALKDVGEVVIRFVDNGKGFDSKQARKVFKESFSTKEHGWGIGLLLARRIVEDIHGGKIKLVKSEPFVETIFEVRLNEKGSD